MPTSLASERASPDCVTCVVGLRSGGWGIVKSEGWSQMGSGPKRHTHTHYISAVPTHIGLEAEVRWDLSRGHSHLLLVLPTYICTTPVFSFPCPWRTAVDPPIHPNYTHTPPPHNIHARTFIS